MSARCCCGSRFFADQPHARSYLTYLNYFTKPSYSRFLSYPQALHNLSLLTDPTSGEQFRMALKDQPLLAQDLAGKMLGHWAGWREGGESSVWKEGQEKVEKPVDEGKA